MQGDLWVVSVYDPQMFYGTIEENHQELQLHPFFSLTSIKVKQLYQVCQLLVNGGSATYLYTDKFNTTERKKWSSLKSKGHFINYTEI